MAAEDRTMTSRALVAETGAAAKFILYNLGPARCLEISNCGGVAVAIRITDATVVNTAPATPANADGEYILKDSNAEPFKTPEGVLKVWTYSATAGAVSVRVVQ